jgi:hypothetical protein
MKEEPACQDSQGISSDPDFSIDSIQKGYFDVALHNVHFRFFPAQFSLTKNIKVEALLKLDPEASTPYIIRYEKGTGRHEKNGVKIGVAYLKPSFIIALPGPHEEAKIGAEVIIEGLKKGWDKETLALFLSQKYIEVLKKIHHSS